MIDKEKIKKCIREIIIAVGDNPDREGLVETPERVANMYEEMFEGMNYTNSQIADMFNKSFECESNGNDIVIVRDIDIFSYCEHHLALMYDMKVSVAYIPEGKVLGLSKIARIAEMAAKRLQLQERIGSDIAEIISIAADTENVAVVIEGKHSCMTARGIKNCNSVTRTTTLRGNFKTDVNLQNRLMLMLK